MAASLARSGGAWNVPQNAEINVTPFVDVMLVLLIIFMVALPVATVSVDVDLPTAQVSDAPPRPPVIVSLTLDGRVYVGETRTSLATLPDDVAAVAAADQPINLRADEGVSYRQLMEVMNRLRVGGFDRVGLVGEE